MLFEIAVVSVSLSDGIKGQGCSVKYNVYVRACMLLFLAQICTLFKKLSFCWNLEIPPKNSHLMYSHLPTSPNPDLFRFIRASLIYYFQTLCTLLHLKLFIIVHSTIHRIYVVILICYLIPVMNYNLIFSWSLLVPCLSLIVICVCLLNCPTRTKCFIECNWISFNYIELYILQSCCDYLPSNTRYLCNVQWDNESHQWEIKFNTF